MIDDSLAVDIAAAGKKSIAVVDFTNLRGNPTELGRFLAEEVSVALLRTHKGFEVIDRTHLKAILAEHKLASTGLIDPATAKKLGQIVGADALLTGTMTPFSESVRVAVKVITTDTARIIAADTVDLPKTKTITELMGGISQPEREDDPDRPRLSRSRNHSSLDQPSTESVGQSAPLPKMPFYSPADWKRMEEQYHAPRADRTMIVEEFAYELGECKGIGSSVQCSFQITNHGADRLFFLGCAPNPSQQEYGTNAFDNLGAQSAGTNCTLSNSHRTTDGLGMDTSNLKARVIPGVAASATVLFRNLTPSASRLALLTIRSATGENNSDFHGQSFDVTFKGIEITR